MQVVADQFGAGIDDTHIKMRGAPVLEEPSLSSHQKMIADKLTVSELMTMAVVALPPVVKVCQLLLQLLRLMSLSPLRLLSLLLLPPPLLDLFHRCVCANLPVAYDSDFFFF